MILFDKITEQVDIAGDRMGIDTEGGITGALVQIDLAIIPS